MDYLALWDKSIEFFIKIVVLIFFSLSYCKIVIFLFSIRSLYSILKDENFKIFFLFYTKTINENIILDIEDNYVFWIGIKIF